MRFLSGLSTKQLLKKQGARRCLKWLLIGLPFVVASAVVLQKQWEEAFGYDMQEVWRSRRELEAVLHQYDQIWHREAESEKKRDLAAYCRRSLNVQEQELYRKVLTLASNPKADWGHRRSAIDILAVHPHVSLIDELAAVAREIPSFWKYQTWKGEPARRAVIALVSVEDKKVIPILIELLESPVVFENAVFALRELLPSAYDWNNLTWNRLENLSERRAIAETLRTWWKENEKTAQIDWESGRSAF